MITFRELTKEFPVWMLVVMGLQIIASIAVVICIVFAIQEVGKMDWSNGLEGIIMKIWKGK